jgi:hypothetical protein
MKNAILESTYPISFRAEDSEKLGILIRNRRSAVLIGMKRVGISGFLRFFIYNKGVPKTYIKDSNHFFIPVDLNDLVEREIFPFWILTFKRIADRVEESDVDKKIKKQISTFFLDSIQTQDLFLTLDYIRKSLMFLSDVGINTTLFFLRFDRLKDAATPEFFDNLQGLLDMSNRKLSYIFTSVRSFHELFPSVFKKHDLSYFADSMYIKPTNKKDTQIILDSNKRKRDVNFSSKIEGDLMEMVDGYSQYLQYSLISIHENKNKINTRKELEELLLNDERILLQSEEIWESLTNTEKEILLKVINRKKLTKDEKKSGEYLLKTGFFDEKAQIFSPIFANFIKLKDMERKKESALIELSKKEFLLLTFLEANSNEVCEREQIIEAVWPEAESMGVSDWAIDRLVARLRVKLKNQDKKIEIVTIKTRGYKLVK